MSEKESVRWAVTCTVTGILWRTCNHLWALSHYRLHWNVVVNTCQNSLLRQPKKESHHLCKNSYKLLQLIDLLIIYFLFIQTGNSYEAIDKFNPSWTYFHSFIEPRQLALKRINSLKLKFSEFSLLPTIQLNSVYSQARKIEQASQALLTTPTTTTSKLSSKNSKR